MCNARRWLVVTQLLLASVRAAFGLAGVPREEQIGLASAAPIENASAAFGLAGVPREEQTGLAQAAPIQNASAASGLAGVPEEEQTGLAQAAPIESASAASGLAGVRKEEQTGLAQATPIENASAAFGREEQTGLAQAAPIERPASRKPLPWRTPSWHSARKSRPASRPEQAAPIENASYRVAVLTAGTVQRFHVYPIPQYLIAPLVQEGHTVDYFLALNTEAFSPWAAHAKSFLMDPAIVSILELNDDDGTIELNTSRAALLVDLVNASVRQAGGALRSCMLYGDALSVFDSTLRVFNSTLHKAMSDFAHKATGWWPLRGARGDAARSNILKMLKQIEDQWHRIVHAEAEHGRYDFLITQRDDSFWLRPFSLNTLLAAAATPRHPNGVARAFSQRCWRRLSTYDASSVGGFNDGILILRREVAEPFGTMFSRLLSKRSYWRLWNIERFLKVTAEEAHVPFASMPAGLIPVQRAGRLSLNGTVRVCLHYFCDSAAGPIKELKPQEHFPSCAQACKKSHCGRNR